MPTLALYARDFDGLILSLDSRKSQKPYIINGENFIFEIDGPKAYFGSDYESYSPFGDPELIYTFRVNGSVYLFAKDGVFGYNSTTGTFYPIYTVANTGEVWPWSSARVGTSYFFSRRGLGVIQFDTITETWTQLVSVHLPSNPCWVTQSYSRLVVLGDEAVVWSAQEDGEDLTPSLATGAGFQAISLVGGEPYRVEQVVDGFLTFTTVGVMKSQFSNAASVFNHIVLVYDDPLISPFCMINIDRVGIIYLTKTGLWITQGQVPDTWQPLMSEYFKTKILPGLDFAQLNLLRFDYARDQQLVLLSVGSASSPNNYFKTFVLYTPVGKWGEFSRIHAGFVEFNVDTGATKGINFGYIDQDGYLIRFNDTTQVELGFSGGSIADYLYIFPSDYSTRIDGTTYIASTNDFTYDQDPILWSLVTSSGLYTPYGKEYTAPDVMAPVIEDFIYVGEEYLVTEDGTFIVTELGTYILIEEAFYQGSDSDSSQDTFVYWITSAYPAMFSGLMSYLDVGLFRYEEQKHADETSNIESLIIGTREGGQADTIIDYNANPNESNITDWNEVTPDEYQDWGSNTPLGDDYDAYLMDTDDGSNLIPTGMETLFPAADQGSSRFYTPNGYSSVYHKLRISATDVGQRFQLKLLDIAGSLTGRL